MEYPSGSAQVVLWSMVQGQGDSRGENLLKPELRTLIHPTDLGALNRLAGATSCPKA